MEIIKLGDVRLRFLQESSTTGGSLDLFEMMLAPGGRMPVPHHHESWEETVYGLSGITTWWVGGHDTAVGPGRSVFIPRGVVHGFRNDTEAPASCLCLLTPGALGTGYFRELAVLLAAGTPDPAAMEAVMRRHGLVPAPIPAPAPGHPGA